MTTTHQEVAAAALKIRDAAMGGVPKQLRIRLSGEQFRDLLEDIREAAVSSLLASLMNYRDGE